MFTIEQGSHLQERSRTILGCPNSGTHYYKYSNIVLNKHATSLEHIPTISHTSFLHTSLSIHTHIILSSVKIYYFSLISTMFYHFLNYLFIIQFIGNRFFKLNYLFHLIFLCSMRTTYFLSIFFSLYLSLVRKRKFIFQNNCSANCSIAFPI